MQTSVVSAADTLSVVVPCYNDLENLQLTLNSLHDLNKADEIVIVDSSDNASSCRTLVDSTPLNCRVNYLWTNS
ncbi:MAG: glycosyltransferase [Rhodobacteraceae bacterium]|nr:glycosyltransferase [Paracoccaceae bacterium]